MKIEIAMRGRPFSHRVGILALIPSSHFAAQVFPKRIHLFDVSGQEMKLVKEVGLEVDEPKKFEKPFTLFQDLERGVLSLVLEKKKLHILPTLEIVEKKRVRVDSPKYERLSLGCHRKQEWERMVSSADMKAIFPLWHRLGLLVDPVDRGNGGVFTLLEEIERLFVQKRPEKLVRAFQKLFFTGFEGMMVPRLNKGDYRGLELDASPSNGSPQAILQASSALLRRLFIEEHPDELAILPHLPPEFSEGRFIEMATKLATIDLEWSKKSVRRLVLKGKESGYLRLRLPQGIASFRLRRNTQDRGVVLQNGAVLEINPKERYFLDRFQR